MINVGNGITEKKSDKRKSHCPNQSADYIIKKKCRIFHPPNPGKNRRKRPENRHESCHHERLAAVLFIKCLRAFKMVFMKKQRVVAFENRRTHAPPKRVTEAASCNCADKN